MTTKPTLEEQARANLGSAFPIWQGMSMPTRRIWKVVPPVLTVREVAPGSWIVEIEAWFREADGWDCCYERASDVSYASWGEAQAALTEMLPRVDA